MSCLIFFGLEANRLDAYSSIDATEHIVDIIKSI